jgi:uncharacterized phage infection (PIP) family protein YhgE
MDVIAEIGGSSEVYLVLRDVSADANITAYGDGAGWISFADSGASYAVHQSLIGILPVKIAVPSDALLGRYQTSILANGDEIARLTIITTLQQDAIKTLRGLADVNSRIDTLNIRLGDINKRINSTESNLQILADSQKGLESVKDETKGLAAKIEDLKTQTQSGNMVTGMVLEGVSLSFAVGFVAGAMIVLVFSNRNRLRIPRRTSL